MKGSFVGMCVVVVGAALLALGARPDAESPRADFGRFVADRLRAHAMELFGFHHPLDQSAIGPFDGPSVDALELARGLKATLVSSAVENAADQIAMWPDDEHPTHLFVCDEETSNPAVQRVDLSKPASSNATTIVTGLVSCDPVRRTPWGSIIVAEEAGATGGLYEILDPLSINTPITVTNRTAGTTSDPLHLVKRRAVGSLSFESFAIEHDGTMIYGDELAPGLGNAGGALYKFVPAVPFTGGGPVTIPAVSPLASGTIFGLRVAASGSSNWGQGAEIGKGRWTVVDLGGANVVDASGNVILRTAQSLQKFTFRRSSIREPAASGCRCGQPSRVTALDLGVQSEGQGRRYRSLIFTRGFTDIYEALSAARRTPLPGRAGSRAPRLHWHDAIHDPA